ncbi:MAG: SRPBCC family protein [Pseudomonadota bacterium]
MSSAQHGSFTIERVLAFAPARVYAAWATEEGKARWFSGSDGWTLLLREFDFRIGGRERAKGRRSNGEVTDFQAVYHDIVPERRIVYSYGMHLDDRRISVSLATVEFHAESGGTRLRVTEQGAFLDSYHDGGSRERGTQLLMDAMTASL